MTGGSPLQPPRTDNTTDGYKSLLIKSEGGEAEEVVDEENGILISAMLRQYFMALKVMDTWKNWTPTLEQHWDNVVSSVDCHHPHHQPSPTSERKEHSWSSPPSSPSPSGWGNWTADKIRERRSSVLPLSEHDDDDSEDNEDGDTHESPQAAKDKRDVRTMDRELFVMRKVFRKWCRRTGIEARLGDELKEGEYAADWTKAIAPRLEGRIRMVEVAEA